jgi:hypothetical protein
VDFGEFFFKLAENLMDVFHYVFPLEYVC